MSTNPLVLERVCCCDPSIHVCHQQLSNQIFGLVGHCRPVVVWKQHLGAQGLFFVELAGGGFERKVSAEQHECDDPNAPEIHWLAYIHIHQSINLTNMSIEYNN